MAEISFPGQNSATCASLGGGGISVDWRTNGSDGHFFGADMMPINSCVNLLLWGFFPPLRHHLLNGSSIQQQSLIKTGSTCCVERWGLSNRPELPPAIKRNICVRPWKKIKKRPYASATKFIVRVEKDNFVKRSQSRFRERVINEATNVTKLGFNSFNSQSIVFDFSPPSGC